MLYGIMYMTVLSFWLHGSLLNKYMGMIYWFELNNYYVIGKRLWSFGIFGISECFGIFIFWYCCYMTTMYTTVCTFLSFTFLLILIFKSTVYCHAHSFRFLYFVLYILFFTYFIFMYISSVLYSIIFALSMERTWLTFHCWLYTLYITVYVTNKTKILNLEWLEYR